MEKKKCLKCSSEMPVIFLHNVPHCGRFAPLCTACVLAHNRDMFCAVCFQIHHHEEEESINDSSDDPRLLMCSRCPALAHATCLPLHSEAVRYLCPNCSNPSFSHFDFRFDSDAQNVVFTKDLALRFLCAAKIASLIMHEAAVRARVNAEEKAREALIARYRAREAIHRVAYLSFNPPVKSDLPKVDNCSNLI